MQMSFISHQNFFLLPSLALPSKEEWRKRLWLNVEEDDLLSLPEVYWRENVLKSCARCWEDSSPDKYLSDILVFLFIIFFLLSKPVVLNKWLTAHFWVATNSFKSPKSLYKSVNPKVCSADHWWTARFHRVACQSLCKSVFCALRSTKIF